MQDFDTNDDHTRLPDPAREGGVPVRRGRAWRAARRRALRRMCIDAEGGASVRRRLVRRRARGRCVRRAPGTAS